MTHQRASWFGLVVLLATALVCVVVLSHGWYRPSRARWVVHQTYGSDLHWRAIAATFDTKTTTLEMSFVVTNRSDRHIYLVAQSFAFLRETCNLLDVQQTEGGMIFDLSFPVRWQLYSESGEPIMSEVHGPVIPFTLELASGEEREISYRIEFPLLVFTEYRSGNYEDVVNAPHGRRAVYVRFGYGREPLLPVVNRQKVRPVDMETEREWYRSLLQEWQIIGVTAPVFVDFGDAR